MKKKNTKHNIKELARKGLTKKRMNKNKKNKTKRKSKYYDGGYEKKNIKMNLMMNLMMNLKKQSKQKGGFWLTRDNPLNSSIKKASMSEDKLINSFDKMTDCVENYHKYFNEHLQNLITIDSMINFSSMEKLFKEEIVNKHFKKNSKIDRGNPLLLRNYLVNSISTSSAFVKEHLIKQIRYKLYYDFTVQERTLITDIDVRLVNKSSIVMIVRSIDNNIYKKSIEHEEYTLDMNQVAKELNEIITTTKEALGYKTGKNANNNISGALINLKNNNASSFSTSNLDLIDSNMVFKKNNNNVKNVKKNNNESSGLLTIIDEAESTQPESGKAPINIFAELEKSKPKQEINMNAQPEFNVPDNLKQKLMLGVPENQLMMGQMGGPMGPGGTPMDPMAQLGYMQQGPQMQPFKMIGQQEAMNPVEAQCQNVNIQYQNPAQRESVCKQTPRCYYNAKKQLCHKDMKN